MNRGHYIREGIRHLLDCDEVFVLPGWQESAGANLEVAVAHEIGLPVRQIGGVRDTENML